MEGNLDTIVDVPLEGSQCTDHDDTGNKTLPDTLWTQFLQDLKNVMVRIWAISYGFTGQSRFSTNDFA